MPLNNCEVALTLTYSKDCVLTDMTTQGANPPVLEIGVLSGAILEINDTKLYVLAVTLST